MHTGDTITGATTIVQFAAVVTLRCGCTELVPVLDNGSEDDAAKILADMSRHCDTHEYPSGQPVTEWVIVPVVQQARASQADSYYQRCYECGVVFPTRADLERAFATSPETAGLPIPAVFPDCPDCLHSFLLPTPDDDTTTWPADAEPF